MPIERQCQLLEVALRGRGASCFTVTNPDLYDLTGDDRDAALDAIVDGTAGPYVLVGGRLVCVGGIDPETIFQALTALAHAEAPVET